MAVAFASHGGIASAAAQTVAPSYPASIAAGDGLVLVRMAKPDTAALTTPAGWTLVDSRSGGAGVFGNDAGPLTISTYFKTAAGTETGTLTCDSTPATVDIQQALITRYTCSGTWDVAGAGGVDSTATTDWSVTATSNPGLTSGDVVQVSLCWPTDAARTWSAEGLTATGATIAALTVPITSGTTLLGSDMASRMHNFSVTAGTASAAPTYAATVNSGINIAGPTGMIRLREVVTGITGTLAVTLPPVAASAAGTVEVSGALAATLPHATATASGSAATIGVLAAALPHVTASAAGTVDVAGTLTAALPLPVASLAGQAGRAVVERPDSGTVTRPDSGVVSRP